MKARCIGLHVLDVLVRRVERIPEGDGELEHADYVLPNEEQVLGFTGRIDDLHRERRHRLLAVDQRVLGALRRDHPARAALQQRPRALSDGCGDVFTAGLLFGLAEGRDRRAAAELGCAVAARVAQGLGTDAGGLAVDA